MSFEIIDAFGNSNYLSTAPGLVWKTKKELEEDGMICKTIGDHIVAYFPHMPPEKAHALKEAKRA